MNNKILLIALAVVAVAGLGIWAFTGSPEEVADTKPTETMKTAPTTPTPTTPTPAQPPVPVEPSEEPEMTAAKTIVDVAVENGSFTTLVTAIQAAGLVETLSGTGPFTVFAPTDEAFAKLPAGTVESLLKDKEKLASILTYHVVSGKVMSTDVVKLTSAKTVNGQSVTIDATNGVKVNTATVVIPDVAASNGVIHVIDTVLLPK